MKAIERVARALCLHDKGWRLFNKLERDPATQRIRLRHYSVEEIEAEIDRDWPYYADRAEVAIRAFGIREDKNG